MKALTLWPEWAYAVHNLGKRVENRTWPIPVGVWFCLHAGKYVGGSASRAHHQEGLESLAFMANRAGVKIPQHRLDIELSAILGRFRVTHNEAPYKGDLEGWRVPAQVGNVFEYEPLPSPIPCKGAQGLWTVPDDVVNSGGVAVSDNDDFDRPFNYDDWVIVAHASPCDCIAQIVEFLPPYQVRVQWTEDGEELSRVVGVGWITHAAIGDCQSQPDPVTFDWDPASPRGDGDCSSVVDDSPMFAG